MKMQLFLSTVSVLLSAAIAVASWLIARRQAITSEEKLRFDLYQKRFEVYSRTVDFLQVVMFWSGSEDDREKHRLFIKSKIESVFLFSPKSGIPQVLENMHKKGSKLSLLESMVENYPAIFLVTSNITMRRWKGSLRLSRAFNRFS